MMKFQGTITALVTPMHANGDIDFSALEKLMEWQLAEGAEGFMVGGSTGEGATLNQEEKLKLFEFTLNKVAGRVPVLVYSGTNATHESVALTKAAAALGAKTTLLICPYYNKPTQEGVYQHFKAIAEATPSMQHILYSIPGRSVIRIENDTVARLAQIPNIIGLKDSSSSQERIRLLRASCGPDFSLLASDDEFAFDCVQAGGDGVISVLANARPAAMRHMIRKALAGNVDEAKKMHQALAPLFKALFLQSNPIPIKALLHAMGKIEVGIRLPLTWLEASYLPALLEAAKNV